MRFWHRICAFILTTLILKHSIISYLHKDEFLFIILHYFSFNNAAEIIYLELPIQLHYNDSLIFATFVPIFNTNQCKKEQV